MHLDFDFQVKNGTPPQRKSALRQLTDKAREFGAGPLFNQILPLLMSPTLEDQVTSSELSCWVYLGSRRQGIRPSYSHIRFISLPRHSMLVEMHEIKLSFWPV